MSLNPFTKNVVPVVGEILRLLPEGLVIGSAIFAMVTLSQPHGIFAGTMAEAAVIFRVFQSAASYLNIVSSFPRPESVLSKCRSGFTNADYSSLSFFSGDVARYPFPSYPIFMVSAAASYIFNSIGSLSEELKILGGANAERYYFSLITLFSVVFFVAVYRLMSGCEGLGTVIITALLGLFIGFLLELQNSTFFGKEGINLIGVPILSNRAASGQPLYLCPRNPNATG